MVETRLPVTKLVETIPAIDHCRLCIAIQWSKIKKSVASSLNGNVTLSIIAITSQISGTASQRSQGQSQILSQIPGTVTDPTTDSRDRHRSHHRSQGQAQIPSQIPGKGRDPRDKQRSHHSSQGQPQIPKGQAQIPGKYTRPSTQIQYKE